MILRVFAGKIFKLAVRVLGSSKTLMEPIFHFHLHLAENMNFVYGILVLFLRHFLNTAL